MPLSRDPKHQALVDKAQRYFPGGSIYLMATARFRQKTVL